MIVLILCEVVYPSRVYEILENEPSLQIQIIDASKSTENHNHLQSYIVYSIKLGPLIVKRRYSEFESLRKCLIKLLPMSIIPPIPEKQTLKSNITTTTTNSLGINRDGVGSLDSHGGSSSNTSGGIGGGGGVSGGIGGNSNGNGATNVNHLLNYIEYRKRMLAVFLNRCLEIESIKKCKYFLNFLDPELNFNDFLNLKENIILFKTSIYRLSPLKPLENLENQLYLTLPDPNNLSTSIGGAPYQSYLTDEQAEKFYNFESKFKKYELVLDNITKINKRIIKHYGELVPDLSELGTQFNALSLQQDSNFIEDVGRVFDRDLISITSFTETINLKFLDKLIELKHFTKTVKELIEYNKKKTIQLKMVERNLNESNVKYNEYQRQEDEIKKIDFMANRAAGIEQQQQRESSPPMTDAELQSALYLNSKKSFYGKIPGVKKLNNVILKYTDANPDQTRKNKLYNIKLKIVQLERQLELLKRDYESIDLIVNNELTNYHIWFTNVLGNLVKQYSDSLHDFTCNSVGFWEDCYNH
ncbi:hypothetical protein CANARDRAFT_175723 [[Candida] arabinofermentans NRRL YB-2248]|uniref:PX domain-containing protein n=1 Tax=[Candida] arabinofermentans NRRL YB-2248 TaxID=983967 RepID=A0A1E4T2I4_9ASCO|nr:hypothetical protein CANARDRAFT_175723 [[Candida] arabinofermentans NRRL YB-2248]